MYETFDAIVPFFPSKSWSICHCFHFPISFAHHSSSSYGVAPPVYILFPQFANTTLLKLFLVESEKRYIIDIKTHYSLLKTCIIKFPLEIKGEENDPKICEFFYDNSSINDIKEELSKKYKIPIDYIEANLTFNNQEQKLDYTYDNKTLKELLLDKFGENEKKDKIEFNKILTFTKINFKESLLNGNQISNKFRNILAKWFIQFSDDKKVMTKENVIHFMQKINNDSSIKGWDKRIQRCCQR